MWKNNDLALFRKNDLREASLGDLDKIFLTHLKQRIDIRHLLAVDFDSPLLDHPAQFIFCIVRMQQFHHQVQKT